MVLICVFGKGGGTVAFLKVRFERCFVPLFGGDDAGADYTPLLCLVRPVSASRCRATSNFEVEESLCTRLDLSSPIFPSLQRQRRPHHDIGTARQWQTKECLHDPSLFLPPFAPHSKPHS